MAGERIRQFGITPGRMKTGERNKITDVPGVLVGHCTILDETQHCRTGVTVVLPGPDNPFSCKYTAAAYVQNGFGKTCGLVQLDELGQLETPIALTNTLSVSAAADGLITYVLDQCDQDKQEALSINPVVGECNDSRMNRIVLRAVRPHHVAEAIQAACCDFAEGSVGAGTGTVCYGLKGGIGSASRQLEVAGQIYTIGVLVQSNFGATRDLVLAGQPVGDKLLRVLDDRSAASGESAQAAKNGKAAEAASSAEPVRFARSETDQGSAMVILATDLPLTDRQLRRVLKRAGVGLTRTGAYIGHGSGELCVGFTTANRLPQEGLPSGLSLAPSLMESGTGTGVINSFTELRSLREDLLNPAFQAATEATEEAVLNSLAAAEPAAGLTGECYESLGELLKAGVLIL